MAVLKVFSVYDSKVQAYARPFFCHTIGEAMRSWADVCNEPSMPMCKHPGDYTLFEIATFDDATGKFEPLKTHTNLGLALEQKAGANQTVQLKSGESYAAKLDEIERLKNASA